MNFSDDGWRSSQRALASELINASGASPANHVTIAGAEHLEVLIEFIRRGFAHVLCRSANHGPHMATPPADILIAPDAKSEADLCRVLTRLGCDLRPCGMLVISYVHNRSSLTERRLRRLLVESGFLAVERIASRGSADAIWRARKAPASMARAA